jgi:hypothetical protein
MFGYAPFSAVPFSTLREIQFVELVVENIGMVDVISNTAALFNSITESSTIADTPATNYNTLNSITESISLLDTTSIISLYNLAINENLVVRDSSALGGWVTVNNTQSSNWVDINNAQ